jgi:NAD(P)H dehydrogenase (quinone)
VITASMLRVLVPGPLVAEVSQRPVRNGGGVRSTFYRAPARCAPLAALLCLAMAASSGGAADESTSQCPPETAAVRVLVVYHSRHGNTEKMAAAVAQGVQRVAGVSAVVKRIQETTKEELQAADGLVLGSPTYFAGVAGEMKVILDDWNWKWKVDFTDKVGGAFATGGGQTGGKEQTVVSLLLFMLNNRMIVAGPLYQDAEGEDIWGEIGASAMTGPLDPGVGEGESDAARRLGERVARLAKKLAQAKPAR